MRFVATKTADQLDLQALHRVRERLVGQRTGIINQIRAFLLERGIAVRQDLRFLRAELSSILAKRTDVLMRHESGVNFSGFWPLFLPSNSSSVFRPKSPCDMPRI
jgi:hypothetical protein